MHKQEAPQKPSDNVIAFPRKNINGPPVSVEEMKQLIEDNKTEVIELFVEELTREIFTITANHGYEISHAKDVAYILISLKAILLRNENIYHPIQTFIDEVVDAETLKPVV